MKEKLDKIHAASIRLLNEAGIRLHSQAAVEMFKKAGQKVDGCTVYPTEEFLMQEIAKAPSAFTLEARNSQYNMRIGDGVRNYAAGYGCPAIIEADGRMRDAMMDDYVTFAKLVHQSPVFKINGGILVQPNDVSPQLSTPSMMYAALTHSDKCFMGIQAVRSEIQQIMDLAAIVWGGYSELTKAPRVMTMISTLSPLQMDEASLDSIMLSAELGQAMMISPGPMAGATGPVTLAGNVALGNAECLAALALSQMVRPGTPVLYGLQATTSDMRTGAIAIGTPGYALQAKYCRAMATYYKLPCRCGGGVNDAKAVSAQSGYEAFMPIFTTALNGVNLMVHAAGILDSWAAMSYEKFMCDLDIISMTEYYLNDMEVNDETLAADLIIKTGPGGIFLNKKETLQLCRQVPWYPKVAHRGPLHGVSQQQHILDNANKMKKDLLSSYQPPILAQPVQKEMDDYLKKLGATPEWIAKIKPQS